MTGTVKVTAERDQSTPWTELAQSSPEVSSSPQTALPIRDTFKGNSTTSTACQLAAGFEARPYLENELAQNDRLSRYQREILEIALDSVNQMETEMQSPTSEAPARDPELADLHDPTMYPSAEVMFFLLGSMHALPF